MSTRDFIDKIGKAIVYLAIAMGAFLFIYRVSTGTAPGTPVHLHNPFQ